MFFLQVQGVSIPTRQLPEIHRVTYELHTACPACPITVTADLHSWASKPRSLLLVLLVQTHSDQASHGSQAECERFVLWLAAAWLFSTCWPFSCSESSVKWIRHTIPLPDTTSRFLQKHGWMSRSHQTGNVISANDRLICEWRPSTFPPTSVFRLLWQRRFDFHSRVSKGEGDASRSK